MRVLGGSGGGGMPHTALVSPPYSTRLKDATLTVSFALVPSVALLERYTALSWTDSHTCLIKARTLTPSQIKQVMNCAGRERGGQGPIAESCFPVPCERSIAQWGCARGVESQLAQRR
jgi:hypothetical protein